MSLDTKATDTKDTDLGNSLLVLQGVLMKTKLNLLTHLSRMEYPTVINWNRPFLFKGMLGGIFHVYKNFNRTFCKQTVETMVRRRVQRRLI